MVEMLNLLSLAKLVFGLFPFLKKINLILFVGAVVLVTLWGQITVENAFLPATPTAKVMASESQTKTKTIIEVIVADGSLKTFLAGLRAAGLVETLIGEGPFTVFAPSDQAFAALGSRTVKDLFEPEDRDKLTKVLNYHIVPGKMTSNDLKSGEVKTLGGSTVKIKVTSSTVTINDAKVSQADIPAKNGIIHVIDKVNMPPDV